MKADKHDLPELESHEGFSSSVAADGILKKYEHMVTESPYLSSINKPYTDRVSSVSRAVETTFHTLPSLTELTNV